MKNLAFFASGAGTNVVKLMEALPGLTHLRASVIVVDQKSSALLNQMFSVPVILMEKQKEETKAQYETRLVTLLNEYEVSWILLAGFMRILGPTLLNAFQDQKLGHSRIVNIHPSLLPAFPGKSGYADAFKAGVKESGVTVHFVDSGVDTGPIWKQQAFSRETNDTLEDFVQRGKAVEWKIYPAFLEWLNQYGEN